jgi:hypothetical protein
MRDVKLPDGTWVTTALFAGAATAQAQCPDDTCAWEDNGPIMGEGPVPVQLQRCPRCGWVRGRYLGNPHPEAGSDEPLDYNLI